VAAPGSSASSATPGAEEADLRAQRDAENFPVAPRLLPRSVRADLVAVYNVARVIDDLGDEAGGDRAARLRAFGADLATIARAFAYLLPSIFSVTIPMAFLLGVLWRRLRVLFGGGA